MTQETIKKIHRIYGIVLSMVAVLAGICFIAACLDIYYTGVAQDLPQIYTRQIVADHFAKIAIPVYACLVLVIGGMVLNLALPTEKPRLKPEKNLPLILSRLQEMTDLANCDEQLRNDVTAEQNSRKLLCMLCTGLLAAGSVIFLIYACNGNHWGSNSTPSMVSAMYMMLGCLALPLAFTIYATYFCRKSVLAEIALLRLAPKEKELPEPKASNNRIVNIARIAILAIGVVLVVLGACNEGTKDILTKAVNICTECVGLG